MAVTDGPPDAMDTTRAALPANRVTVGVPDPMILTAMSSGSSITSRFAVRLHDACRLAAKRIAVDKAPAALPVAVTVARGRMAVVRPAVHVPVPVGAARKALPVVS